MPTTNASPFARPDERMAGPGFPGAAVHRRDAVVITDADGEVRYISPNFESVFGYSRFEILGKRIHELRLGARDADFYAAIHEALRTGQVQSRAFAASRTDGTKGIDSVTAYPVWDVEGCVHGVGIRRDMTRTLAPEERFKREGDDR